MLRYYIHTVTFITLLLLMRGEAAASPFLLTKSYLEKQQIKTSRLVCISLPGHGVVFYPFIIAGECDAAPSIEDAAAIAGDMIALHGDILDAD